MPELPDAGGGAAPSEHGTGVPRAVSGTAAGGPPSAMEAVVDRLDVDAALARLPDEFRAAVVLRDLCDLDYAEIARVLDIPPGTVRSRIARGRAQLADLLGNPGPPDERRNATP